MIISTHIANDSIIIIPVASSWYSIYYIGWVLCHLNLWTFVLFHTYVDSGVVVYAQKTMAKTGLLHTTAVLVQWFMYKKQYSYLWILP